VASFWVFKQLKRYLQEKAVGMISGLKSKPYVEKFRELKDRNVTGP
jgi:hypothetical protein